MSKEKYSKGERDGKEDYHHDKGKRDALEGKYESPHERVEDLIGSLISGVRSSDQIHRKSYEEGRAASATEGQDENQRAILRIDGLLASIAAHEESIQQKLDAIGRKLRQL